MRKHDDLCRKYFQILSDISIHSPKFLIILTPKVFKSILKTPIFEQKSAHDHVRKNVS